VGRLFQHPGGNAVDAGHEDEVGAAPARVPLDAPQRGLAAATAVRGGDYHFEAIRPFAWGAVGKGPPGFQPSGGVALHASVRIE
jgi:hypothetical protein